MYSDNNFYSNFVTGNTIQGIAYTCKVTITYDVTFKLYTVGFHIYHNLDNTAEYVRNIFEDFYNITEKNTFIDDYLISTGCITLPIFYGNGLTFKHPCNNTKQRDIIFNDLIKLSTNIAKVFVNKWQEFEEYVKICKHAQLMEAFQDYINTETPDLQQKYNQYYESYTKYCNSIKIRADTLAKLVSITQARCKAAEKAKQPEQITCDCGYCKMGIPCRHPYDSPKVICYCLKCKCRLHKAPECPTSNIDCFTQTKVSVSVAEQQKTGPLFICCCTPTHTCKIHKNIPSPISIKPSQVKVMPETARKIHLLLTFYKKQILEINDKIKVIESTKSKYMQEMQKLSGKMDIPTHITCMKTKINEIENCVKQKHILEDHRSLIETQVTVFGEKLKNSSLVEIHDKLIKDMPEIFKDAYEKYIIQLIIKQRHDAALAEAQKTSSSRSTDMMSKITVTTTTSTGTTTTITTTTTTANPMAKVSAVSEGCPKPASPKSHEDILKLISKYQAIIEEFGHI